MNIRPRPVRDLLDLRQRMEIPAFQRKFTWRVKEADDLLADIDEELKSEALRGLFLGTIILLKPKRAKAYLVVDGQQRITTLLILLIAMRVRASELNNEELKFDVQRNITLPRSGGAPGELRLRASSNIRLKLEEAAQLDWVGPSPNEEGEFEKIYQRVQSAVSYRDADGLRSLLNVLLEARIVFMEIRESSHAYDLFEKTNARGTSLEVSELLKNFLISRDIEGIEDIWGRMEKNCGGKRPAPVARAMSTLLRHFQIATRERVKAEELYRELKRQCRKDEERFVNKLVDFSNFSALLSSTAVSVAHQRLGEFSIGELARNQKSRDRFVRAAQGLRLFGVTQPLPVLYPLFDQCRKEEDPSAKKQKIKILLDTLEALEKFHFVNNRIGKKAGNMVYGTYESFAKKIREASNPRQLKQEVNKLVSELQDKLIPKEDFTRNFEALDYRVGKDRKTIMYIFDRIENASRNAAPISLLLLEKEVDNKSYNLDHIYPKGGPNPPVLRSLHSVGNLVAMTSTMNDRLKDKLPSEKFPILKKNKDKLHVISNLVERYESQLKSDGWGEEIIERRAKSLAEECYNLFKF